MTAKRKRNKVTLRDIGENGLVQHLNDWSKFEPSIARKDIPRWAKRNSIETGMGDDTAVIVNSGDKEPAIMVTTDTIVEGTHFMADSHPLRLGHKAAASNLSDLASMGAWPAWCLVSLAVPPSLDLRWIQAFYKGLTEELKAYDAPIIGGDCVRSPRATISITLSGYASPKGHRPLRSIAEPGQTIYVTGTLGDSGAGLDLVRQHNQRLPHDIKPDAKDILERHYCPTPRVHEGLEIVKSMKDTAMMDLSDGLATDLPRLLEASGVAADIHLDKLPLSPGLERLAPYLNRTAVEYALFGGEDYELLFATSAPLKRWRTKVGKAASGKQVRITPIGQIVKGEAGKVRWLDADEKAIDVTSSLAFEHF